VNVKVNLFKRVRTAKGTRYCPVVESANNRIKAHAVIVDGREEKHPEGAYYISWYEGRCVKRRAVGNDPVEAANRRAKKQAEFTAKSQGVTVVEEPGKAARGALLVDAIRDFLDEKKATRKSKTHADYESTLEYFQQSCTKRHLTDITRKDLLAFTVYCREELELSPRTVFNKFARVAAFLRAHGIEVHKKGVGGDAPRFTVEEPEVYEREDLDTLFAACDADERVWFEFFLMTGMREQEVMYTYWRDVNFKASTVKVTHKPDRGWSPKAYKGREIPIPAKLVTSLKAWKARRNDACELLFPTAGCNPKLDFLDCLKAVATRAGMDKDDFWLHKFRATFATWHLWAGVDLRTVQMWMGHSDLDSTTRYLKPSRSQQTHDKVNATFA